MNKIGFRPPFPEREIRDVQMTDKSINQASLFPEGENSILLKPIYDDIVLKFATYQKLMRIIPLISSAETKNVIRNQKSQCIRDTLSIFKTFSQKDVDIFISYAAKNK